MTQSSDWPRRVWFSVITSPGEVPQHAVERLPTHPTIRLPRQRHHTEMLLAVALLGAVLAAELALIRVGLDAQDEGYFVEQATRVLRGEMPYRDFDSLYTPGLLYLHAALFHVLGGPEVLAVRAVGFVSRLLMAGSLFLLGLRLTRPLLAVLPAVFVLLAFDRVPRVWEPHPGWPSAAFTVLACLALSHLPRRGERQ